MQAESVVVVDKLQRFIEKEGPDAVWTTSCNFMEAVKPVGRIQLESAFLQTDLQNFCSFIKSQELPQISVTTPLEEYKSFLLGLYGEDSGQAAVQNVNKSLLDSLETIENLFLLDACLRRLTPFEGHFSDNSLVEGGLQAWLYKDRWDVSAIIKLTSFVNVSR